MGRVFLLLVVMVGLSPGLWWRSPPDWNIDETVVLSMDRLRTPRQTVGEGVELAGAWRLRSPNHHFAGFSALLAMGDGTLLAVSDHRREMRFTPPGSAHPAVSFTFFTHDVSDKRLLDLESLTRDPATGRLWAGYERGDYIERYETDYSAARVQPPEMRDWPNNRGPEAMARLADGRFVVLSEGSPDWFGDELPGLLFPGDPVEGARPVEFSFRGPDGFVPVDMSQLPDGRVVILLREFRWSFPLRFESALVVADPAEIAAGEPWPWHQMARLAAPVPMDNYEGLAIEPAADGGAVLWLISDNNRSKFQRTLLLKLLYRPNEKARGTSPRAS